MNPELRNRLGENVAYVLHPENVPTLIVDEASMQHRRSIFATKSLWVTQYDPDQRYPAGDFPNQHPGGAGLPAFVAGDRPVDGEDIVVWHNFALTHFPRPEVWPVMPVDTIGFTLKPHGFLRPEPGPGRPRELVVPLHDFRVAGRRNDRTWPVSLREPSDRYPD